MFVMWVRPTFSFHSGRLLQHLEQTPDLDTSQIVVKVLVDRILDVKDAKHGECSTGTQIECREFVRQIPFAEQINFVSRLSSGRLHSTAGRDRAEEKDRIGEKHRKRRLQKRGEKDNDEAQGKAVTLTRARMRLISKRRRILLFAVIRNSS
jgi:hypothetical protein